MMNAQADWKDDRQLEDVLCSYTRQGLQRVEILSFMERDFSEYQWSLRTLDRRLRHFSIYRSDRNVNQQELRAAVESELNGPGQLLGYRAMQNVIRQKYHLNVPRAAVHDMMYTIDPDRLKERRPGPKRRARKKGNFTTKGTNWTHSLDGHAKLMGYQRDTFTIAIYGCIDTASRKIMYLKAWTGNSDPRIVAKWYFDYLNKKRIIACNLRIDKGTETGDMATMHAYLRGLQGEANPVDTIIYGPSTSNQIERWWKELHDRMEKYYKHLLRWLKDQGHYDPHDIHDRNLLAFIFIPLIQKELDLFKDTIWNTHEIGGQKDVVLPCGVPNHIYDFPGEYGLEECGKEVSLDQLAQAAMHSRVLEMDDDYLDANFRAWCESIIPDPSSTEGRDCATKYLLLKEQFRQAFISN